MIRKNSASFLAFVQAAICATGLLGGLAVGAWILFATDFMRSEKLFGIPPDSIVLTVLSVALIFALAWFGVRIGLALARKVDA